MKKLVLVGLALALTGCGVQYSDGDRIGTITKFSKKGIFYKTWEGEMLQGGLRQGSDGNMQANIWEFSVLEKDASELVPEIQKAQLDGARVKIHYSQLILPNSYGDQKTGYLAKSVKEV